MRWSHACQRGCPLFLWVDHGTVGPYMSWPQSLSACLWYAPVIFPGIFVIGFSYPVVPKGKARIRVQISAVHSEEDIDRCVEAFVEVGRLRGALP